jgi:nitrate reductase molybdenum cofactor assembly chaperone NarJ/NarW
MRLLPRLRERSSAKTMQDRLVWQAASLLLAYPDDGLTQRLDTVDELLSHVGGSAAVLLGRTLAAVRVREPVAAAMEYVATFDMRRHATMYLTYWTAGDTRNRGREMLAFATAYREAGVEPPRDEAPDHLPVVLEFAATVDPEAGRRLLSEHRVPIDVLRGALADAKSPYGHTVAAVCQTLPVAPGQDIRRAERLARQLLEDGPPAEAVGLQPFNLTVPPRRQAGAPDV